MAARRGQGSAFHSLPRRGRVSSSERTEKATPKRRDEARRKGQSARSSEISNLFVLTAGAVGIYYAPSALFVLAAFFVLVVLLHYSTVISELAAKNLALAQRLALLENRLREEALERD